MLGGPHARSRASRDLTALLRRRAGRACGVRRRTKAAAGSSASFSTRVLPRTATTARFAAGSHTRQPHPARERERARRRAARPPPSRGRAGPKEHRPGHAPLHITSAAPGTAPGSGPTCHQRRTWVHRDAHELFNLNRLKHQAEIEIWAFRTQQGWQEEAWTTRRRPSCMAPSSRATSRCAATRNCAPASQRAPRCSFGGALGGPAAKSDTLSGWFPTDLCAPSACVPATPPPPCLCFFPLLACRFPVVALSRALPLRSVPWHRRSWLHQLRSVRTGAASVQLPAP